MRMHLLAGGSDLLVGDSFSISPRQSSNTLAIGGKREEDQIPFCGSNQRGR